MTCPGCESTNSIHVDNYKTCTDCGRMYVYQPVYTSGYSGQQRPFRKQYYSRIKRFIKRLQDINDSTLNSYNEEILYIYADLEFIWINSLKQRKYFFSQKVVLFFILEYLGIEVTVPVLKNKDRTETQLLRMRTLIRELDQTKLGSTVAVRENLSKVPINQ